MIQDIPTIEIQEKDLELIVSEKTLGSLTTNAKQIKALVESALPKYDIANYNESNIDVAKKDKAMLNNASKVLNAKRIELEKEFLKPFSELKDTIADTVKLIGECSGKIDTVVKQSEQKEKDAKRETIQKYWDGKSFTMVPLDKVFDDKWLNKGSKEKDIFKEIDTKISKINDDLVTLEAIGQDVELLKSIYLGDLDLNKAIQYANTLKQNKEKVAAIEPVTTPTQIVVEPVQTIIPTPEPVQPVEETMQPIKTDELLTRAFMVVASRDKIIALGEFMNKNGIHFERINYEKA